MLCSNVIKQGHEDIAIEIVLTHVFESLRKIRPSAIVIDKHKTSLNTIQNVVNNNVHR